MTPIGHIAVGLAAKPASQKIPLGVLLAASWLLDILYFLFAFLGIESTENFTNPGAAPSPWSHGLLMALVWSSLAGLIAWRAYRSQSSGLLIGLVVFSHWALDLLIWDNVFVLLEGSPQIGFGLFNALGDGIIYVELGLFLVGMAIFWTGRVRSRARARRLAAA